MKAHVILAIILSLAPLAHADLLDDDVSAESDAAMAQNKSVKENLAKEKDQAKKAHQAADDARAAAKAKQQSAIEEMNKNQTEIESLTAEKAKLKDETVKMNQEATAANKTLADNKLKIEKAKAELAALKQLHDETNKKLLDIAAETDKTDLELKELERNKVQSTADFQQLKADQRVASDKLQKIKADYTQKQAAATLAKQQAAAPPPAAAAPIVAPVAAAVPVIGAAETPSADTAQFGTTTPMTPEAIAQTEEVTKPTTSMPPPEVSRSISSTGPNADAGAELVLKKDCKVYDRTTKDPQVIGAKYSGTSITKTDDFKYWVGFSISGGQKGYIAKTCF